MGILSRFKRKKVSTKGFTKRDALLAKAVREERAAKKREDILALKKRISKAQSRGKGKSPSFDFAVKAGKTILRGVAAANQNMMRDTRRPNQKIQNKRMVTKRSSEAYFPYEVRTKSGFINRFTSKERAEKAARKLRMQTGQNVSIKRIPDNNKTKNKPQYGQYEKLGDTFDFMGGLYG